MQKDVKAAQQGDRQAFERLVRHYAGMAGSVAYEKLQDVQLAEDAVQEAFTEAFLNLHKLRMAEAFPGWFKVIVVRQCSRMLRRNPLIEVPCENAGLDGNLMPDIADMMEQKELKRLIQDKIGGLTTHLRLAVQLFYFQGYSLKEMSDFLGVSVPALKKRLFDARHKLKGSLRVPDVFAVINHLHEGGTSMLHIVNGDSVGETLRQAGVSGDILVWREVYSHGPVFAEPEVPEHRAFRSGYLERTMGVPEQEYLKASEAQEQKLAAVHQYDEIVLWFEHDLFDQTMLCFLLHQFSRMRLKNTRLSLLCIGEYPGIELFRGLGQLTPEQIGSLSGTWQTIGETELAAGSSYWEAYTSPDPHLLQRLVEADTSILPFAKAAYQAHLSRFPSVSNGLGIVEQTTLKLAASEITSPYELFRSVGDRLHILGMGDLQYWSVLRDMSQGSHPLLQLEGLEAFPGLHDSPSAMQSCTLTLTELGQDVMKGKTDWMQHQGIDEWYGGVHVQGTSPCWRWDEARHSLVEMPDC